MSPEEEQDLKKTVELVLKNAGSPECIQSYKIDGLDKLSSSNSLT